MHDEHNRDQSITPRPPAIEFVREGMTVEDSAGAELGRVELVRMGDPEAVTTRGNRPRTNDLVEVVVEAFTGAEPELPEATREQLLRYGYIKIDGPGLADVDRYVRSDHIRVVEGDRVILTVPSDQLPKER